MDYKELIRRLYQHNENYGQGRTQDFFRVCLDCKEAATAITDLLARAEKAERERDTLIKRTSGDCWSCIRRYECNSRRGPHNRCWEFDNWLLEEDK